jgi:adenylyltransferase/sulfurtransferase
VSRHLPNQSQQVTDGTAVRARIPSAQFRVLVVGVGGLGSVAAAHLAVEGVRSIAIVDSDTVDLSNLHRQLLYHQDDIGRPKVSPASERLRALVPHLRVEAIHERLDAHNAVQLLTGYDFIIDGSDNFATKFLVNDTAVSLGIPFSHGGVLGFIGQTMTIVPGRSACYRCLFNTSPDPGEIPTCREAGILGAVAGMIGGIQAAQALAYAGGTNGLLVDRLLTYDALEARGRIVQLRANPRCAACGASALGRFATAEARR